MTTPLNVGFIGLGAMGWPMAGHLYRAGMLRAVGNRSMEKSQRFATLHANIVAAEAAAMAATCEVIALCVSADADVLALTAALSVVARPGLIVIDHSTVSSETAKQAAALMRKAGGDFLDAPVSGGVEGAKNGKLSIMVGGEADTLARARPALDTYAARVSHMGASGAGQATKAVNQVLIAGIAQAVCEGLALGQALGLDAESLLPTLSAGAAQNWFLEKRGATMLRNEFSVGFKLGLLHKDLKIVAQLARAAGTDHSIIDKSLHDYASLMGLGHADEDISALIRLKKHAG